MALFSRNSKKADKYLSTISAINETFQAEGIKGRVAGYRINQFGELEVALVANGHGNLRDDLEAMGPDSFILGEIRNSFPFFAGEVVARPNNERTWPDELREQTGWALVT